MCYTIFAPGYCGPWGDSKRPFIFLVFSSVINIALDLAFIIWFDMGIAGAALATVIAQFLSAGILLVILCAHPTAERPPLKKLGVDMKIISEVVSLGLPIGLQKTIIAFSNTIVIAKINAFGSGAMAGWSIYRRVDQIVQNIMTSLSNATTVFVGQNIGAGRDNRIRKGLFVSLCLSLLLTAALDAGIALGATPIIRIFNGDADVHFYGKAIIYTIIPFQLVNAITQTLAGYMRGHGDSKTPMLVMIACYVAFRQIYLLLGRHLSGNLTFILACYPISWLLGAAALAIILLLRKSNKNKGAA